MPSRSVRRRQNKRLKQFQELAETGRASRAGRRLLIGWRIEARYRAEHLGAPAAWALASDPHIRLVARTLDPSGELEAELRRVCAEAVAEAAGRHLVSGSRPLADRGRRHSKASP
jgi:hypothetical protein